MVYNVASKRTLYDAASIRNPDATYNGIQSRSDRKGTLLISEERLTLLHITTLPSKTANLEGHLQPWSGSGEAAAKRFASNRTKLLAFASSLAESVVFCAYFVKCCVRIHKDLLTA